MASSDPMHGGSYLHEESISFSPVIKLLYLAMLGVFVWAQTQGEPGPPWVLVLVGGLLVLIPLLFGRLRFRVDESAVTAEFGYLGWPARRIPISAIERARVVEYRPLRQFGGWGIRSGRLEGERTAVYSLRGNRGVLLELSNEIRVCGVRTKRFLLGCAEPERLTAAIDRS
jgi:hypothetical protein